MNCSAQRHGPVKKVFGTKLFSVVEMRYARRIEPSVAWVADDAGCDGRAVNRPKPGWGKKDVKCAANCHCWQRSGSGTGSGIGGGAASR